MKHFYTVSLLRGSTIGLYAPIWILALFHSGYNLFWLGMIGTIFEVMKLIFEIPSGAISDKLGVKFNLVTSFICLSLTWLLFPFASHFSILLLILLTWTLSESMFSGTFESWLSHTIPSQQFSQAMFNNTKVLILFIILISPLSGYLYQLNHTIPFVLAGITSIILTIYMLIFVKVAPIVQTHSEQSHESIQTIIKNAATVLFNNKRAFNIIIASFFFAFVIDTIDRYWQPYAQHIGLDTHVFGWITTIGGIVLLIVLHLFSKYDHHFNQLPEIYHTLITCVTIILILFLTIGKKLVAFISISLVTVMDDLMNTLINNALNQEMNRQTTSMATIFSLNGAFGAMGEILSGVLFGYVISQLGYQTTFMLCSAILMVPLMLYVKNIKLLSKR
ncbi:MFS transporter [Staphylococcus americanisciuri]|uniref:MFS transporter n=1 Tax=Staphylococcus americanisciuri TaxID=2973940 RepID=A0ABT2F090_9STAP|nr:MFS transporter [Staphylococcus americanisciuri]MCS4485874.1 MFS transporter [Staphylococcus americanisciuri]